ncbi:MAG: dTDP-4-dehydrorhamnose reductase [Syntrophobacteraceae bacterium]|nr:dTDP-4-dehydrorhamnose reductase [Syntrophobacteraceae bacterium]
MSRTASSDPTNVPREPGPSPGSLVLVVGHRGMLGVALLRRFRSGGVAAFGLDLPDVDITRVESVTGCMETHRPRMVINCAGYTAVDKAESEPAAALAVNRDGPANLATACREFGIPMIHISTDYIFDGKASQPYLEEDPPGPLGAYALSKWEGEEAVRANLARHLIVRTSWMFGFEGHNFVKTILNLAREREELRVIADQHGCPTWSVDLADTLAKLTRAIFDGADRGAWGTYHFCGDGITTWHAFAEEIVQEGRRYQNLKATRIVPISTADYPTAAPRPAWSAMDCGKIARVFAIVPPSWRIGLRETVKRLCTEA